MPEKRSNKVLSISSVDTQIPSTSTPDAERECSMAALVEICGGKVGVYSPMIAIERFTLPLQLIIELGLDGKPAFKNDDCLGPDPQFAGD